MPPFAPQLLPNRIESVHSLTVSGPVPVENATGAEYTVDEQGRRWVSKVPHERRELLAEALGWLLSGALEVPTPNSAIYVKDGTTSWLSEVIEPVVHWTPARAQYLVNPDDLGKIVAIDAIIGNFDRHDANLLLKPEDGPDRLSIFSIDLSWSWIGEPAILKRGIEPPPIRSLVEGIPVDMIRDAAMACSSEALRVNKRALAEYAQEACRIANQPDVQSITNGLMFRCMNAPSIVKDYINLIERRP